MKRRVCLEKVEEYNKKSYIRFESIFASELCRYQSRIKPDVSSEWIRWYYIKYDNKYIGSIWLEKNKDDKFADLGVFIAYEKYRNKGLGTLAIKEILEKNLDIGEVRLRVRNENVRAKKCYEKIGFSAVNEVKKDNGVIATEMKIDKKIYRNFVEKRCLDAIQHKELRKQGVSISQIATIYKVNRETVSSFIKTI